MAPELKDILDLLEKIAPSTTAEDWDNPGLQVGRLSQEIRKILVSLDPTFEAAQEASKRNAQLLLTHHPLIFKPISHLDWEIYPGNVIFEAFENGISIVALHTNLDVAPGGINDMLADLFQLNDVEVLQPRDNFKTRDAGLGRIGTLSEPVRLSILVEKVKTLLGAQELRFVGDENRLIRQVAVIGGSGGGMVSIASKKGADLLITGDIRHHDALEAGHHGLALVDGGHFCTEKASLTLFSKRFRDTLNETGWNVQVEIYKEEKNPIQYWG